MRWEELRYRPYRACYDHEEIIVVPCDRGLSNAQASGLDPGWFKKVSTTCLWQRQVVISTGVAAGFIVPLMRLKRHIGYWIRLFYKYQKRDCFFERIELE